MKLATLEELQKVLDLANKYGVQRLEMTEVGVIIEYDRRGPPPYAALPEALRSQSPASLKEALETPLELCRCGHEDAEHSGSGFCLRGCEASKCQPPSADENEGSSMMLG